MTNIVFLFFFLPLLIIIYYNFKSNAQKRVLFIFNAIFLLLSGVVNTVLFILLSIITFLSGRLIQKIKNKFLKYSVFIFNILLITASLFVSHLALENNIFDYLNNLIGVTGILELTFPLGLSFLSIQFIMFLWDCLKGKIVFTPKFFDSMLYLFYFPKLLIGPVVSYDYFTALLTKRKVESKNIFKGGELFAVGIFQNVIIAGYLYKFCLSAYSSNNEFGSCVLSWLTVVTFFLFMFFTFESYCKMSTGISLMLGIKLPKNNYPFLPCNSVSDFSKKWNVTVVRFFGELFASKKGTKWDISAPIAIWVTYGLWFGFNLRSVAFGLILGIIITIEKVFNKIFNPKKKNKKSKLRFFKRIIVFVILAVLFSLLSPASNSKVIFTVKSLFCIDVPFWNNYTAYYIREYFFVFIIAVFSAINSGEHHFDYIRKSNEKIISVIIPICEVIMLLVSVAIIIGNNGISETRLFI